MKYSRVVSLVVLGLGVSAGCSQENLQSDETGGTGTGASGGAAGMSSGATGGTAGAATSTGGAGGSAGTSTMMSGAPGVGGVGGSSGGPTGSGGMSTGGSAGVGVGGGAGTSAAGSGGTDLPGGMGGMGLAGTGTGGTGTAGTGTAGTGTAGAGMAGSGGGALDPMTIVPDLEGFYWEGTCAGTASVSGKNCPILDSGSCPSGSTFETRGTVRNKSFKVHGTPGQVYTINFEVRGIAGTRCYEGGTPGSTATPTTAGPNNGWYVGGTPSSKNSTWWNTYELHVESPSVAGEANLYYLNGFPASPDWCTREATFPMGYSASFKVMGDSTMRFSIHDENCQAQQNCGPDEASTTCTAPKMVNVADMNPPGDFAQPPVNAIADKTFYPQWLYFDVKTITSP